MNHRERVCITGMTGATASLVGDSRAWGEVFNVAGPGTFKDRDALAVFAVTVVSQNIPPCLLTGFEGRAIEIYREEVLIDPVTGSTSPAHASVDYVHDEACGRCSLSTACRGFLHRYREHYGPDAFAPGA